MTTKEYVVEFRADSALDGWVRLATRYVKKSGAIARKRAILYRETRIVEVVTRERIVK